MLAVLVLASLFGNGVLLSFVLFRAGPAPVVIVTTVAPPTTAGSASDGAADAAAVDPRVSQVRQHERNADADG